MQTAVQASLRPPAPLRRSWDSNKPLTIMGVAMLLLLFATVPLVGLDAREITGVRAWMKPMKFAVSGAIYAFTFLWMLSLISGHRRLVGVVSWVTMSTFILEMVLIVMQVLRGTTSHFNAATRFDLLVFNLMGGAITIFWVMAFIAGVLLLRQRLDNRALAAGIRAGLFIALVGMGLAFLMTAPTASQVAAAQDGAPMTVVGAHAVGVEDGGPGLPLVNWSTEGGDLRVPHFFGLHGLQVLPLVGWLVARRGKRLGERRAVGLVRVAGAAYLGLVGLLTWQALRGQSLVAPDALTLGTLGGLVALTGAAALMVLRSPQGRRPGAGRRGAAPTSPGSGSGPADQPRLG